MPGLKIEPYDFTSNKSTHHLLDYSDDTKSCELPKTVYRD